MSQLKPTGTTQLASGMRLRALATSASGDIKRGTVYTIVKQDHDGMWYVRDDAGDENWAFDPTGGVLNCGVEEFEVVTN